MCSGGITTRAPTGLSHRTTVRTARPTGNRRTGLAGVRFFNLPNPTLPHVAEAALISTPQAQQLAEIRSLSAPSPLQIHPRPAATNSHVIAAISPLPHTKGHTICLKKR
jgi:hypothetical protein